jgi:hypothetical protein
MFYAFHVKNGIDYSIVEMMKPGHYFDIMQCIHYVHFVESRLIVPGIHFLPMTDITE